MATENGLFQPGVTDLVVSERGNLASFNEPNNERQRMQQAIDIQQVFMEYSNTVGQVPWQEDSLTYCDILFRRFTYHDETADKAKRELYYLCGANNNFLCRIINKQYIEVI